MTTDRELLELLELAAKAAGCCHTPCDNRSSHSHWEESCSTQLSLIEMLERRPDVPQRITTLAWSATGSGGCHRLCAWRPNRIARRRDKPTTGHIPRRQRHPLVTSNKE